jgi:hypothetical protein
LLASRLFPAFVSPIFLAFSLRAQPPAQRIVPSRKKQANQKARGAQEEMSGNKSSTRSGNAPETVKFSENLGSLRNLGIVPVWLLQRGWTNVRSGQFEKNSGLSKCLPGYPRKRTWLDASACLKGATNGIRRLIQSPRWRGAEGLSAPRSKSPWQSVLIFTIVENLFACSTGILPGFCVLRILALICRYFNRASPVVGEATDRRASLSPRGRLEKAARSLDSDRQRRQIRLVRRSSMPPTSCRLIFGLSLEVSILGRRCF